MPRNDYEDRCEEMRLEMLRTRDAKWLDLMWLVSILQGAAIGWFLAGPRKDKEFERWLASEIGIWELERVFQRVGVASEEAAELIRQSFGAKALQSSEDGVK